MNARQREYFRNKLLAWRGDLLQESSATLENLQEDQAPAADLADRAPSSQALRPPASSQTRRSARTPAPPIRIREAPPA